MALSTSPDVPAAYHAQPLANDSTTTATSATASAQKPRVLSAQQIAEYAKAAGFRGQSLITAVAVALAESSGHTDALGPAIKHPESWVGPYPQAMGLWQVLPAWKDSGYGSFVGPVPPGADRTRYDWKVTGPRDARRLNDPAFNARSAFNISGGGSNFKPWSTYTSGAYVHFTTEAKVAAGAVGSAPVSTDPTATSSGDPTVDTAWSEARLQPIRLTGNAKAGELGQIVIDGQVDLSVKQPSQLTLTFLDEDLSLLTDGTLQPSARLQLNSQKFTVTDVQIVDTGAGAGVQIQALPSGIVALMHTSAPTVSGIRPLDYVKMLARAAGVAFHKDAGTGIGYPKQDVAPQKVSTSDSDKVLALLNPYLPRQSPTERDENGWEVAQRLGQGLGFDLWEDEAGLFFGSVTSLALGGIGKASVTWPGAPGTAAAGAIVAMTVPSVTFSVPSQGRFARVSVSMQLPPEARYWVHIGRQIDMTLGPLLTDRVYTVEGDDEHKLRVTRVSWSLGDLTAPVTVEAESAVDVVGSDSPYATGAATGSAGDTSHDRDGDPTRTGSKPNVLQDGAAASAGRLGYSRTTMKTITVPGTRVRLTVNVDCADLFAALAAEFNREIEPLDARQCGGFANRGIDGSHVLSNHAYGAALDLNSLRHPHFAQGTFTAAQRQKVDALCVKYQCYWGGRWSRARADEMHWEVAIGPTAARKLGAQLLAQLP